MPRKGLFCVLLALAAPAALLTLLFLPNPVTDSLVSRVCTQKFGRPIALHNIHFKVPSGSSVTFLIGEADLRKMLPADDSAVGRFVRQNDLARWLNIKNSRWIFKSRDGVLYLRLLEARAGEVLIQGGLCYEGGRVSRWNAAFRLPKSWWGRFPSLVGKRFAQDPSGRRLFKLSWSGGLYRLWGRSGPVLEASWQ